MVVSLVVIAGAAVWWTSPHLFPGRRAVRTEAPRLSIVVLPFTNLSGDPNQDYFADGITEDLTTDLSRLAGSLVISRNTAFTFKGKVVDARQIGRELGVRYVLEGSVRRMGRSVRINAQLVDAGTGGHLWAEQIDADQGALATSLDNLGIASRLARALSGGTVNVEGRRAPRANADVVDLVMRGWSLLNAGPNREDVHNAEALFEAALRIDPDDSRRTWGSPKSSSTPTAWPRFRNGPRSWLVPTKRQRAPLPSRPTLHRRSPSRPKYSDCSNGSMRRLRRMTGPSPSIATSRTRMSDEHGA